MGQAPDLHSAGDRIEALLDGLRAGTDPRTYGRAEELLRLVTDLYGAALGRVVSLTREQAPSLLDALLDDELVSGLLMVHDLHPESLRSRIEAALASVRPHLAGHGGDVELIDVDAEVGAVFLRLLGSCDGCPSSAATLEQAVEQSIRAAAPEIEIIDVAEAASAEPESTPITLGRKPVYDSCPVELAPA